MLGRMAARSRSAWLLLALVARAGGWRLGARTIHTVRGSHLAAHAPRSCPVASAQVADEAYGFVGDPLEVWGRIASIALAAARVRLAGDDDGATLRAELSRLGPVFCKVGQTLATRPDIVGLGTSRSLGQLQDAMAPEPEPATAMATLAEALGSATPVSSVLANITAAPVAAASLAEVYRADLCDELGGGSVAVKIQRPGLARKVGLDLYVLRYLLSLFQARFKLGDDAEVVVAVLDEARRAAMPRPLAVAAASTATRAHMAMALGRWARVCSPSLTSQLRRTTSTDSLGCTIGSSSSSMSSCPRCVVLCVLLVTYQDHYDVFSGMNGRTTSSPMRSLARITL